MMHVAFEDRLSMALGDIVDGVLRIANEIVRTSAGWRLASRCLRKAEQQVSATVVRQGDQLFGQLCTHHRVTEVKPVLYLCGHVLAWEVKQLTQTLLGIRIRPHTLTLAA